MQALLKKACKRIQTQLQGQQGRQRMQKETLSNSKEAWYQALPIDPTFRQLIQTQIKY